MFRTILFFGVITSAFAGESLDLLVNASVGFSMAIQQQLATTRSDPSLIEFVAKTIVYADAKTAYFNALREAAPELMNIATGRCGLLNWIRWPKCSRSLAKNKKRWRTKRRLLC